LDKAVGQHIEELERRIQQISVQMMDGKKTQSDRNHLEAELRAAQQAVESYRKALEFERKLQTR
jgi:flagellin-like hook-associated protein FlgL